jgi:hypothetical protein
VGVDVGVALRGLEDVQAFVQGVRARHCVCGMIMG